MAFYEDIERHGGVVELAGCRDVVREALAAFDGLLRDELGRRNYDVRFTWLRAPEFWAAAGVLDDRPTIAMTYGTALALEEAFMALLSVPTIFTTAGAEADESPWAPPPPYLGAATKLEENGAYWREPNAENRKKLARLSASLGLLFILHHEAAHIRRNHLSLTGRSFLADGPTLSALTEDRMFELDADFCGVVETAGSDLLLSSRGGQGPMVSAIFAVGMTLFFLDRDLHVLDHAGEAHAHPLHRLFVAVDALGVSLGQKSELDRSAVEQIRSRAYVLIHHCAETLGNEDNAFRNVREDTWLTEEYQAERSRYFEWERDMIGAGRMPSIPGCPSAIDLSGWDARRKGES